MNIYTLRERDWFNLITGIQGTWLAWLRRKHSVATQKASQSVERKGLEPYLASVRGPRRLWIAFPHFTSPPFPMSSNTRRVFVRGSLVLTCEFWFALLLLERAILFLSSTLQSSGKRAGVGSADRKGPKEWISASLSASERCWDAGCPGSQFANEERKMKKKVKI